MQVLPRGALFLSVALTACAAQPPKPASPVSAEVSEDKTLAQRLAEMVEMVAPLLPRMINAEERLETIRQEGDALTYGTTLVDVQASEFEQYPRENILRSELLAHCCRDSAPLAEILRAGGRVNYDYIDSAGLPLMRITVEPEDCD